MILRPTIQLFTLVSLVLMNLTLGQDYHYYWQSNAAQPNNYWNQLYSVPNQDYWRSYWNWYNSGADGNNYWKWVNNQQELHDWNTNQNYITDNQRTANKNDKLPSTEPHEKMNIYANVMVPPKCNKRSRINGRCRNLW